MDDPEHVVEEPFSGWLRVELQGQKPYYKSPFPRTVLRSGAILRDFLAKEKAAGRMMDIEESKFSFKRKYGVRIKDTASPSVVGVNVYYKPIL